MVEGCVFRGGRRLARGGKSLDEEEDIREEFLEGMSTIIKTTKDISGLKMSVSYNQPVHSVGSGLLVRCEGSRRGWKR